MAIYFSKPSTLGQGLKRVVKQAGNGKAGRLQRCNTGVIDGDKFSYRRYSNGVEIGCVDGGTAIGLKGKLKAFVTSARDKAEKSMRQVKGWMNGKQSAKEFKLDNKGNIRNATTDITGKDAVIKEVMLEEGRSKKSLITEINKDFSDSIKKMR